METTINEQLETFFEEYEARFNRALSGTTTADVDATQAAFADCFVEASPSGVSCGKNDANFRAQIPKGNEFYRSLGTQSMKIISLKITPLDEYHTQVKVHWRAVYKKKDDSQEKIDFDVFYFLQTLNRQPKIFAYITGDEQAVYKERGLLPN
jgi:hypothetical protein